MGLSGSHDSGPDVDDFEMLEGDTTLDCTDPTDFILSDTDAGEREEWVPPPRGYFPLQADPQLKTQDCQKRLRTSEWWHQNHKDLLFCYIRKPTGWKDVGDLAAQTQFWYKTPVSEEEFLERSSKSTQRAARTGKEKSIYPYAVHVSDHIKW